MEVLYPTFNSKLYLKQVREEASSIINAAKEKRNKVTNTLPPIHGRNPPKNWEFVANHSKRLHPLSVAQ
jgi:hypothetical protein